MKPSLQLKMGQQLTMTPQLQQAIRLLQLSSLDLKQEIQEIVESNPMLEAEEADTAVTDENSIDEQFPNFSDQLPEKYEKEESDWLPDETPSESSLESRWDNNYISSSNPLPGDDADVYVRSSVAETLQDHLEWQLNLTPMSDKDRLIGLTLIESINADGYLTSNLSDIFKTLKNQLNDLEQDEVTVLQHRIQQFDPIGCASEELSQCLQVQLQQCDLSSTLKKITQDLICNHLQSLGMHDYVGILKKAAIQESQLKEALAVIKTLNPRPGAYIEPSEPQYVTPDIIVRKHQDRWQVDLNSEALPKLRINNNYASMIQRADSSRDNTFLKNNLQEARWFLKNLQSRNETLLRVARKIVEYQNNFFNEGETAMKPLVLTDIAKAIDMHESTISRVTTQKYMHTPKGLFELKYFFSSHVQTTTGGECSSTAIRAFIKKIVAEENTRKPLSDSKIAALLGKQGIKVARRTIAKYRESLNISPSNKRKGLA